jgi:16S rRNA (uracil1498-N3)-methyltransferase
VENATELGVSHVLPILSERSEKKSLNMERLQKIAVEASEQSGRGNIPIIHPITKLEESFDYVKSHIGGDKRAIDRVAGSLQMLAFHTEGEFFSAEANQPIRAWRRPSTMQIALFVGPEGGWSEREVELFHKENIPVKCLGKQVLRAETAAIASLSQFVFVDE